MIELSHYGIRKVDQRSPHTAYASTVHNLCTYLTFSTIVILLLERSRCSNAEILHTAIGTEQRLHDLISSMCKFGKPGNTSKPLTKGFSERSSLSRLTNVLNTSGTLLRLQSERLRLWRRVRRPVGSITLSGSFSSKLFLFSMINEIS